MAMTDQLSEFNLRLSRIADPRNKSYYDPELKMNIPKRVSKEYINRKKAKAKQTGVSALLISVVLGAVSLMLSYLISGRFHLLSLDSPVAIYVVAAILAVLIGGMMRLKTMPHMGAQFAGVAVMIAGMHNLVWMFPDQFAAIYSPEFVSVVQATTQAGSLTFMGATIIL